MNKSNIRIFKDETECGKYHFRPHFLSLARLKQYVATRSNKIIEI